MLINISSDNIYINCGENTLCVPRGGLEVQLPQVIHHLYQQHTLGRDIFVINGPGSFTNLRIGCLVLNMLKDLGVDVQLYTIAKMDLYAALYREGCIPGQGVMYIGQQKNYWLVDFDKNVCKKTQIDTAQLDSYFEGSYRVDQASVLVSDYTISYALMSDNQIAYSYCGKSRVLDTQALGFTKVDTLIPNYILQPNISTPKTQA